MLAIVTCLYNFAKYKRREQNFWRFLRQMKRDNVPVYGVEIHTNQINPITKEIQNWVQIEANCNQIMWQKETALNIAEKMVPDKYDKIAWIDSDVWFNRSDWCSATEKELEKHEIVQMFRNCYLTDIDGSILDSRNAVAFSGEYDRNCHPGFAWAMNRNLWIRGGGLYQFSISGGGDTVMCHTLLKKELPDEFSRYLGINKKPFEEWSKNYSSVSLGSVPMSCYHEWHGNMLNRGYSLRTNPLCSLDIEKHIKIGNNKLLEFTTECDPQTLIECYHYFYRRKEDG